MARKRVLITGAAGYLSRQHKPQVWSLMKITSNSAIYVLAWVATVPVAAKARQALFQRG